MGIKTESVTAHSRSERYDSCYRL